MTDPLADEIALILGRRCLPPAQRLLMAALVFVWGMEQRRRRSNLPLPAAPPEPDGRDLPRVD